MRAEGALLLSLIAWSAPALAGDLFINGVRADGVRDLEMEGVDVRFDAQGNVYIHAPQYDIEIVDASAAPPTDDPPSVGAPPPEAPAANPQATHAPPSEPSGARVEPGRWWLVVDDAGSAGHVVEVAIGGRRVTTVRSGQDTGYVDLYEYLRAGDNAVTFTASADGALGGGALHVYLGRVVDEGGSLAMPEPAIDYARRSSSEITGSPETFTLSAPAAP